ncbi:MAG: ATP-binding protein [Veillonellales bacterium]
MFKKLRLKLTVINMSIMLALFFLLILGTYYFSQINMANHADSLAQKIMEDIQDGRITDLPQRENPPDGLSPVPPPPAPPGPLPLPRPERPPGPNFFFVETSPDGSITFHSSGHSLPAEQLSLLTRETLQTNSPKGSIVSNQINYSFYQSPLKNQPGTLLLFHDNSQEKTILQFQAAALLLVGLICSLLSFGASFFLANRAMIPIQKAWQQQKDFLSDASHELRTPLAVIQTNLDIVRGSPDETVADQRKWLDNIQEETVCMSNLVNSLLFLSRADSHQQKLILEPLSVNLAIAEAAAPFEAMAAAKAVSLKLLAASPLESFGDAARIKQVINILLDNAIRHTPSGGHIQISLRQKGSQNIITIADSGEGIPAECLDKIFDRFYQVDQSRAKGGSGLGLSIAKWIIESHGGTITVASTLGKGTNFTIALPDK